MNAHEQLRAELMARVVARGAPATGSAHRRAWVPRPARTLLAALAVVLVAGVAVAATGVLAPAEHVSVPAGRHGRASATVIAGGLVSGRRWRFAVRPCPGGSVATATLLGPDDRRAGGGFGACLSRRPQPLLDPVWLWTPGITVITDVVRADVASEQFVLRRRTRQQDGAVTYRSAGAPVVRSRPIPPAALGGAGSNLRFVTLTRPYAVEFSHVIARDASGRVLRSCARVACSTMARHDR